MRTHAFLNSEDHFAPKYASDIPPMKRPFSYMTIITINTPRKIKYIPNTVYSRAYSNSPNMCRIAFFLFSNQDLINVFALHLVIMLLWSLLITFRKKKLSYRMDFIDSLPWHLTHSSVLEGKLLRVAHIFIIPGTIS